MNLTQTVESFGQEDQSWVGTGHDLDSMPSMTLDVSLFTAGTHYPNGYVRSGTPIGRVTATGLYGPYNNGLANGQDVLAGFVGTALPVKTGATRVSGALFDHGRVVEAKLPIAIDAPAKVDVAGRIWFV